MGGRIVEELSAGLGGRGGAFGLGGGKGTEADKHGGVNGAGVVQEGADDFLEASFVGRVHWWRVVGRSGELGLGAVVGARPSVGGVLRPSGRGVGETLEGFFDVAGHGDVESACRIVPVEGEAEILGAGPVCGDLVETVEGVDEVLSVAGVDVFYAEVVDTEDKRGAFRAVLPEAWGEGHEFVSGRC